MWQPPYQTLGTSNTCQMQTMETTPVHDKQIESLLHVMSQLGCINFNRCDNGKSTTYRYTPADDLRPAYHN